MLMDILNKHIIFILIKLCIRNKGDKKGYYDGRINGLGPFSFS